MVISEQLKSSIKSSARLIRESRNIILACHLNPDGDAIGSMLGLGFALLKLKKNVTMLCSDKVPPRYLSLPGARKIKARYHKTADLAISVDCGSVNQLSRIEEVFNRSKKIIEIDHHEYRTRFGDIQLVDEKACSVAEIIFLLLKELGIKLDKKITECLLTSILVESLSFSRQDVNKTTFDICSQLMENGVDFRKVSDRYYWQRRLSAVRLTGLCLARVKMMAKNQLAWSMINRKDFSEYSGMQEDVDSVADDMMTVEGVKVAILFREIEGNTLRVSLRSRDNVDIGYLASIYGGGGHHDVAGCRIHNNNKTIEKFLSQACNLISKNTRSFKS